MIIQSEEVWLRGQFLALQLEMVGGKIASVYPYGTKNADGDYGDKRTVPGFIDVHTHGAHGYDTNDGEPKGLQNWMAKIPEEGVTGILSTTVAQMPDVLSKAMANAARVVGEGYEGTKILGIHFEGPYLDMDYKGAQPPEAIAQVTVEQFETYQTTAKGLIKYITPAPEYDGDFTLTKHYKEAGVAVSIGHSSATFEQAMLGIVNGAASMAHVHDGVTPCHHRNPGLVGTAFCVKDIYDEIICDGCHSHVAAFSNYFEARGKDFTIMISGSLRAKHYPPGGNYELGGHPIEISESGLAYLKGINTITGSTLNMNRGLKILMEEAMMPFDAALNSCIINPARCLDVGDREGKLVAGYDVDVVVLDGNYKVIQTYCRGKAMLQGGDTVRKEGVIIRNDKDIRLNMFREQMGVLYR